MAQLKIFKVSVLPAALEASALYFVQMPSNRFSIYLTDKDGLVIHRSPDSSDVSAVTMAIINNLLNQPGGIAGLDLDGNLIANVIASGIDGQNGDFKSDNDYVWKDIVATFGDISYVSSGNRPSYGSLWGNLRGLRFDRNTMEQVYVDFHIPHDYALGTMIYPHVHWCPSDNGGGSVRWGFEYYIARGHGQDAFPDTGSIIEVVQSFSSGNVRRHFVAEPAEGQGIPAGDIEPDAFIKMRIYRDGSNDSYNDWVHAWQADLHYQASCIGTRNRSPNFYTP